MERFRVLAKYLKMVNVKVIKADKRQKMLLIHYPQICVKETVDITEEYKLYKVIRLK